MKKMDPIPKRKEVTVGNGNSAVTGGGTSATASPECISRARYKLYETTIVLPR
jgi:hypothetical protein